MRTITYERIYYRDVETIEPPAELRQAAEQAAAMMHPDRSATWYAMEHNPRFLERQIRGNPAYRVTISAEPAYHCQQCGSADEMTAADTLCPRCDGAAQDREKARQ